MVFELPVKLDQALTDEITEMALKAYKALGLVGLTRMDFMIDNDVYHILVNQILCQDSLIFHCIHKCGKFLVLVILT